MRTDGVDLMPADRAPVVIGVRMPRQDALDRGEARRQGLDPRTKIVLVVVCSAAVMGPGGLRWVPPVLVLGIALAVWERSWARAAGLPAVGVVLWFFGWVLPLWWPNPVTVTTAIACAYLIRFAAALGIGTHLIATTSPTRLAAGVRAWRGPRPVSVVLGVMLRFFPVVAAESGAVMDAMRLRGLTGARGLLRHPILTLERFTVPMIAASLRASEDLSASAILRGLGSRRAPTTMLALRFGTADVILLLIVAFLAAITSTLPVVLA